MDGRKMILKNKVLFQPFFPLFFFFLTDTHPIFFLCKQGETAFPPDDHDFEMTAGNQTHLEVLNKSSPCLAASFPFPPKSCARSPTFAPINF